MSSLCSVTRLILLFSVIILIESAITTRSIRNKHVHNIIHKEDKTANSTLSEFPIDDQSNVEAITPFDIQDTTLADDIVESSNRRRTSLKVTIPLHHKNAQVLSSIKHPLPKRMYDIMPHEPVRPVVVNQHKVHHDFLHHEGPKLQRRLHHHFTIEEIRQRRKELREKLLARRKKLARITTPLGKKENTLMMPTETTEKMMQYGNKKKNLAERKKISPFRLQKEYILRKQKDFLEENSKEKSNSISSDEATRLGKIEVDQQVTDSPLIDYLKDSEENKHEIMNPTTTPSSYVDRDISTTLTAYPEASTELLVGSASKSKFEFGNIENDLPRKDFINVQIQKQRLLDSLKRKHRLSSKLAYQTSTLPQIETTTWLEKSENISHEQFISHLKYILGERDNNLTTTNSIVSKGKYASAEVTLPMTEQEDMQMKSIPDVTSPAVYVSKIRTLYATSTYKPAMNSTQVSAKPEMYQDWRAHLRKAIRRRLQRLRENPETN